MARQCDVCAHPRRAEIDQDLAAALLSLAAISRKYNHEFSEDSARGHRDNHLMKELVRHMAIQTRAEAFVTQAESLMGIGRKMAEVVAHAEEIRDRAEHAGNDKLSLEANAQVGSTISTVAKLLAIGQASANSHSEEELEAARALIRAIRVVMPAYPEAQHALTLELENQGQFDLAAKLISYVRGNSAGGS